MKDETSASATLRAHAAARTELALFARLGRLVVAHPWRVVAAWVVLVALVVPLAPGLDAVTQEDQTSFLPDSYESVQAQELAERAFPDQAGSSALFVISRREGGELTSRDRRAIREFTAEVGDAGIERVEAASPGPLAPDGSVALVQVAIDGLAFNDPVADAVDALRERADQFFAGGPLRAGLSGDAAILKDTRESYRSAEGVVGIATIVLILVLLGAIFRSPLAALLPIVTIGLVFVTATQLVSAVADALGFEVGSEVTSLLIVVLFGIGTDYILFVLFRYRERLRAGAGPEEALVFAIGRVGRAVTSAALVVMVAFLALLLSRFESFTSLAPVLVISVAVTAVAVLTLVPAAVALFGERLFWPSSRWRTAPAPGPSKRVGETVAAHPVRAALASGGLLVVLAAGTGFYTANYNSLDSLPDDTESAEAFATLDRAFPPGALNPTQVYVEGASRAELVAVARRLRAAPVVAQVESPAPSPSDPDVSLIRVSLSLSPFSNEALDAVEDSIRPLAHASAGGAEVLVGGQTGAFADVRKAIERDYRVVYPVAAGLILIILAVLLRSLVAPLYLLAGVALGFAATLGATVAVFQGLAGEPGLSFAVPLILYLFVVAIGTDYNILMTTRLREEFREGLAPREAADMSVEHAGPTVAAAAVILAGTFASLMLTGIGQLVEMGFAVSTGIVLVAFVMATVLVPSVAALLGRTVWWPGHQGDVPDDAQGHPETAHRDDGQPTGAELRAAAPARGKEEEG